MKNYPERLKILLDILGIRQNAFAERLGITPTHVSKMLKGGNPSPLIITAISYVFKIERRWLETGEGEIFSGPEAVLGEQAMMGLVKAYKKDISRLNDHIEELVKENLKLRKQLAGKKLAEVEKEVQESKRRKKEFEYPQVADKGRRVEET